MSSGEKSHKRKRDASSHSQKHHKSHKHKHSSSSSSHKHAHKSHSKSSHSHHKSRRGGLPPGTPQLTDDDFFARSKEFRAYLSAEKRTDLSSLDTSDARSRFKKFVKKWNAGFHKEIDSVDGAELQSKYYNNEVEAPHAAWDFAARLNADEQLALDSLRDRVQAASSSSKAQSHSSSAGPTSMSTRAVSLPTGAASRSVRAQQQRRAQHETALDELAPRLEGREAQRAKRRAKAERSRASGAGDLTAVGRDFDVIGGDDSEKRALLRAQQRRERREVEKAARNSTLAQAHKEREQQAVQQFAGLLANQAIDPKTGRAMVRPRE